VIVASSASPICAQAGVTGRDEAIAIRNAAGLEWRGQLDEAEAVLTTLLAAKPTSTGGLFALERVTRSRDRLDLVLPWADRYLEVEPAAGGIWSMKLRILAEIDSTSALRPVADDWFAVNPDNEDPWREVARVWEDAFGDDEAEALLLEGRERLGDDAALAMEIGDLRAERGDAVGAVREWARGVRRPGADLPRLRRRVAGLEGDPAVWAPALLEALIDEPTTADRRLTAVRMALQLGLHDDAAELAEAGAETLSGATRAAWLEEVAADADASEAGELALWALVALRAEAGRADAPSLDVRIASAALAVGDTSRAVDAQARLARALPPGSDERRRVIADLIRVEATGAAPATLVQRYEGFRAEFGAAPELDELTALVAAGVARAGRTETALGLVGSEPPGPRSALERGYVLLATGDREAALPHLEGSLPGLAPERATEVIQLLTGLQRCSPSGADALGAAAAAARWGRWEQALEITRAALEVVPPEDRVVLLAAAGRQAIGVGDLSRAEVYLDAVVGGYPDAPERPEAMLRLAELRSRTDAGRADAQRLLEELIVEGPERAVVPAARRLLERLRGAER
jgi:tetratricopeptide (TPR) repeat protein